MEDKVQQYDRLTDADYEAAVEQFLVRMRALREQMERDQSEIDRLKEETRGILARLKAA